jgi:hypothetical protein
MYIYIYGYQSMKQNKINENKKYKNDGLVANQ